MNPQGKAGGSFGATGHDGETCDAYIISSTGGTYEGLKIDRISLDRPSRMIGAPVEKGHKVFDNKVRDPNTITVSCYVHSDDFGATLEKLEQEYAERSWKFCTIVTKEGIYENMALQSMPHEEDSQMYDVIHFNLVFKEVMLTSGNTTSPSNSDYSRKASVGKKGLS